ncbi:MAG: TlpA family protein disulfide reductase [Bacteroidaceae bacterium]|nr:TlpA family protein disulfide reductase [Bacteroidaceae bacterium]MBQ9175279.1 TlpA family protein disulfide reductase [Bacteroidaceae bacterium]MBR1379425.1 TlpA family protein disulfide reductase [Bacteroidaceae bacterium]
MKRIFFSFLVSFIALCASAQSKTTVRGTFTDLADGTNVYLVYSGFFRSPKVPAPMQTKLQDGKYEFTFDQTETTVFHLETPKMTFYVVCEPGETIECRDNEVVKPGRSQETYKSIVTATWNAYNADRSALYTQYKTVTQKVNDSNLPDEERKAARDSEEYQTFLKALNDLMPKYEGIIRDRIRKDPTSLWNIISLASFSATMAPSAETYELFADNVKNTLYGQVYCEKLGISLVGKPAPAFTLPDPEGNSHSLADVLKANKYVLIDFWASWCKPCRKSIPDLKEAYAKYHDRGFTIVSVSVDSDRDAWLKAVGEEQMPWLQLHDKEGVMRKYGVEGIPSVFFMRSDGTVIFEKLYGDAVIMAIKKELE